jgi:hypothetical protein
MELTSEQQITKSELETLMEKHKDNESLIVPIQTTYTIYLAEINALTAMLLKPIHKPVI